MSHETEWAEGKQWEETSITKDDRERLRPWVAVGLLIALGLFLSSLGCASKADEDIWQRVCYEKPVGQTEQGLLVVIHSCVTLEAFTAAQR